MRDTERHYEGGLPNPETMGIDPNQASAFRWSDSGALDRVSEVLGRPTRCLDEDGFQREVIAAAVGAPGELAWVESRAKGTAEAMDVSFQLFARRGGEQLLKWEVETYNPYFGCIPGHLSWWGERILFVYREKHRTVAASVPLTGEASLHLMDDEWEIEGNLLICPDEDLVEVRLLPHLTRGHPIPNEFFLQPPKAEELALVEDREGFQRDLAEWLFPLTKPTDLETGLLIGSLAYSFWDSGQPLRAVYRGGGHRRWESPRWLPFYWALSLSGDERSQFVGYLSSMFRGWARKSGDALYCAVRIVGRRLDALAKAAEAKHLPPGTHDFFWNEWSLELFERDLDLFPAGFREAYWALEPDRERWTALACQ